MKNNTKILIFAACLGIICSSILTAANFYMAPFREANEKAEEIINLFAVLSVPHEPQADANALVKIFDENIHSKTVEDVLLYEYVLQSSGVEKVAGIAVFFNGAGLWGPVKGVLALEPDLVTIKGISFYQQEETPGLGGKIGSPAFQKQFIKKKLISENGQPGFIIAKPGKASAINAVDGISGASMTSDSVQVMLDALAKQIGEVGKQYGK